VGLEERKKLRVFYWHEGRINFIWMNNTGIKWLIYKICVSAFHTPNMFRSKLTIFRRTLRKLLLHRQWYINVISCNYVKYIWGWMGLFYASTCTLYSHIGIFWCDIPILTFSVEPYMCFGS
jgi:hypothetical protein